MRVVLVLLLCLAPLAHAGSAQDPEVTDGSGDSVSSVAFLGAVGAELLNAWYEEAGDDIVFQFEVGTLCADTAETIEYRWTTTVNGADVAFGADLFGTGGFCTLAGSDTSISPTGATATAAMAGNVAVLVIPKSAFGDGSDGTVLSGTFGTSAAYVGSPAVWNDADRAPDVGGGRDYVMGGAPEPVAQVLHVNVTEEVLRHETNASEPVDLSYVFSWEGPANVTLAWSTFGNGTVNVTVTAPDGTVAASCNCTDGVNETRELAGTPGIWNVSVDYQAFEGQFSFSMVEAQAAAPPATNTTAPEPTTETNTTDDAPVEESPGLPVLAVPVVVGLLARLRRHETG